jgi:soluble lytic murein transglycosylase-like protein
MAGERGWDVARMSGYAYRESRCNPGAYNGRGPDNSYGLLQINTKGSNYGVWQRWCGISSREQLFDPETNIRCAAAAYREMGTRPWRA